MTRNYCDIYSEKAPSAAPNFSRILQGFTKLNLPNPVNFKAENR